MNSCELDSLETGKETGIRFKVTGTRIITYVEGSDRQYKECIDMTLRDKSWSEYYMFMVAKNFLNEKGDSIVTDMDVNAVIVGATDINYLPSQGEMI